MTRINPKKTKDSIYYMKMCKKCLEQISVLPRDNGKAYLRLKKKAEKYLRKAKELEALKNVANMTPPTS